MDSLNIENDSILVIVATRVGAADEWTEWGFDNNKQFSSIEMNPFNIEAYDRLTDEVLLDVVVESDLCIFHGDYFTSHLRDPISSLRWKNFQRGINLYIHVDDIYGVLSPHQLSNERRKNVMNFLSGHETYGLGGDRLTESKGKVALLGRAVRDKDQEALGKAVRRLRGLSESDQDADEYKISLDRDGDEHGDDPASRFSMLKHRLSHLFIPLSVDLQGWEESGFSNDYAQEIAEDYEGRTDKIMEEAKNILGKIKKVVGVVDKSRERDIGVILMGIENENSEPNCTLKIIDKIDERKYKEELKKNVLNEDGFKEWFKNLEKKLDKIRDNVFYS